MARVRQCADCGKTVFHPEAKRCRGCWRASITDPERNAAIAADYLGGLTRRQLSAKYGLGIDRVAVVLRQQGALLTPEQRRERRSVGGREGASRAAGRQGRKAAWPDCPEHLRAEYMKLRNTYRYPASEARRMLEARGAK